MALSPIRLVLISASLAVACAPARPPAPVQAPVTDTGYVTLIPEVTYAPTGRAAGDEPAPLDPNENVMASILAIPRGEPCRHGPCIETPAEHEDDHALPQLVVAR